MSRTIYVKMVGFESVDFLRQSSVILFPTLPYLLVYTSKERPKVHFLMLYNKIFVHFHLDKNILPHETRPSILIRLQKYFAEIARHKILRHWTL